MSISYKYLIVKSNYCIFHEQQLSNDDADMENMGIQGLLAPLKAFGYVTSLLCSSSILSTIFTMEVFLISLLSYVGIL